MESVRCIETSSGVDKDDRAVEDDENAYLKSCWPRGLLFVDGIRGLGDVLLASRAELRNAGSPGRSCSRLLPYFA